MSKEEVNEELTKTLDGVYELRDSEDNDASYVFHTLPDRRLTTYYRTIEKPVSLHMVRQNINHDKYVDNVRQFVEDLVRITHNARVFNRKDSVIYDHALILDGYIRAQLERLKDTGKFNAADLEYPDLGPLPEGLPSGDEDDEEAMVEPEDDEDDEDAVEEEEDDDDDEEDHRSRRRSGPGRRGRPRRSTAGRRPKNFSEMDDGSSSRRASGLARAPVVSGAGERKKRGRPPTVDKPHEHRIKAIMRGVRKEKEPKTGRTLYQAFEKLPDFKQYPQYFDEVREPIALDMIRKNIKRRKYASVDMFLMDMNLMFNNAKQFNADGSQIFQDAVKLQQTMMALAEEEMKKPDSVYQDPDSNSKTSRLPLDQVEHRGEIYRVGDWVHISNLNDPAKPTIGQIFRIWKASDGQKWINACWYYRPEQTVHRHDKLFYENEVVKSGQYRDHLVDEILEKCFVMFFTKYQRGRPSGIGDRSVYCCESRYNENEKTFNKIRTWKACIPDEVRSTDYPMDLFDRQHPLRRVVSPIRHLLPDDAKDDDPIPEPKMGVSNAPPIVGAVYKRPIDPNDPPEQPTPDDEPAPPHHFANFNHQSPPASMSTPRGMPHHHLMSNSSNNNSASANYSRRSSFGHVIPHSRIQPAKGSSMLPGRPTVGQQHTPMQPRQSIMYPGYTPPAPPSTFTLPEGTQSLLPEKNLASVARVKSGQMAWFTNPPIYVANRFENNMFDGPLQFTIQKSEDDEELHPPKRPRFAVGHSAKYMAWKLQKQSS
ncbi:hypothetical protein TRICI_002671 [Trichomonascus ciferrii]|uniref:BAH domain-containing protein n=1 Tax=Trichomonascus ciferrii TaxID=44093 RepID=A0A642V5W5_9ASCO|nr:hypothetical protein TRICI_002671 [Trichomonascus ciferrii]